MTEGQIRYQTLMENQRHNLEVEDYNRRQAEIAQQTANTNAQRAETDLWRAQMEEQKLPYEIQLLKSNYDASENKQLISDIETGLNIVKAIYGSVDWWMGSPSAHKLFG